MRISDWSSDVCSSDLATESHGVLRFDEELDRSRGPVQRKFDERAQLEQGRRLLFGSIVEPGQLVECHLADHSDAGGRDRKHVVSGKSVSVRVDFGGRRIIKKKNQAKKKISITR